MIYISVYQLIRQHIEGNTEWGQRLLREKQQKEVNLNFQQKDELMEQEYSAVHFELDSILQLLNETIQKNRTSQQFVLVEGLCNYHKLTNDHDRFSLRLMDEFFRIEKKLGTIYGVVSLQFESDKEYVDEHDLEWEQFPEPEVVEEAPKAEGAEGEEGEEGEPPAAEEEGEEGEKKEPSFKPEDYKWTVTDRRPSNLPTLFLQVKGPQAQHDVKSADMYSSSQYEAVAKCLDDFCQRLYEPLEEGQKERHLYTQVLFAK